LGILLILNKIKMKGKIYLWVLAFIMIAVSSCKKEPEEVKPDTTANQTRTAILDTTDATPGDVVMINFSTPLTQQTYEIDLGDRKATLVRTSSNQGHILIPAIQVGPITFDLSSVGVKDKLTLEINNYTAITDPDPVFAQYKTSLTEAMAYVQELSQDTISPVSNENVQLMKNLESNFDAIFATLTTEEKIEAAYFISKMKFNKFDFSSIRNNPAAPSALRMSAGDRSNRISAIGGAFVASSTTTVAGIFICVAGMWAPEPTGLTKVLGIAGAATSTVAILVSMKLLDELGNEMGVQFSFANLLSSNSRLAASDISLTNGVAKSFQIQSSYRRLMTADASSSSSFIKKIFASINEFNDAYNKFKDAINYAKSWFLAGPPVISPFTLPIETSIVSKTILTPAENLSITNVSNPAITVTYTKNANDVNIKATSTNIQVVTSFTFDIVYNDTDLGITNKKTINATYDPISSKLFGDWIATQYDNFGTDVLTTWYTGSLGGCSGGNNYFKYDGWKIKFKPDGTFENFQGYASGSYKEYVPNGGIVCSNRSTVTFYPTTYNGTYNFANFNKYGQLLIYLKTVNGAVAGTVVDSDFVLTLVDDNTMNLIYSYNGYERKIVLTRQ
jgi:hypothetical protein